MVNKSYSKGYRMERELVKRLESIGFHVIRSGKSKFPDMIAVRKFENVFPKIFYIESKWNKYLSKEEKSKADTLKLQTGLPLYVFYKDKGKINWYKYGEDKIERDVERIKKD